MGTSIAIIDAKDEDLFMIEKTGDDKVYQKKLESIQNNRKLVLDVEQSKLRKISSGYKLYGKLESTSKVPAVTSRIPNKERRKTVYNDPLKLEKLWNDKKESIEKGKQLRNQKKEVYADPKKKFNAYNLWDGKVEKSPEEDYLVQPKREIRVPEHLRQKPSLLPAVEVPVGGQSYNPHQNDHQELILAATNKEVEKINEENKWIKKVEKYFVSKADAPSDRTWMDEMCQGLGLFEREEDELLITDTVEDAEEIAKFSKLVKPVKKTKQQRRRELREKLAKKRKEAEKKLNVKESEVFRVKTMKKELAQRDEKNANRAQIRAQIHIDSLYKPKRLSKYRFEESEIPLNLPSELSGSLRTIKVEGNLLEDRFKSLQKRNLIETRVPQSVKRKFKLKKEVKRRHKPKVEIADK